MYKNESEEILQEKFLQYLEDNIVLFDGGMGTEIYDRGYFINKCYDAVTLESPDLIKKIHTEYIEAGADVIETNAFGANRDKLQKYGYAENTEKINRQGVEVAQEAAEDEAWIAGAVGPMRDRLAPIGDIAQEESRDIFRQQIGSLIEAGVDLIILETFNDLDELFIPLQVAKEIQNDIPVIAQMTLTRGGKSIYGHTPEIIANKLSESAADVIGLNCTVGPRKMLSAVEKMVGLTDKPISVMPNAGLPQKVDGRNIYMSSPEYIAEYSRRFVRVGAKVIGGCCGTNPEHIREISKFIKSISPRKKEPASKKKEKEEIQVEPIPMEKKSKFAHKIANGKFVKSVELVPPSGTDITQAEKTAKVLKKHDIDTVNIPDGPRAMTKMGATYLAKIFIDEVGIEPILHYTARDKNMLGIISDLLGIQAIGIKNMLLITGDPPKMGDYPDATAVFDIDSIGLISIADKMNHGIDMGGNSIGKPTEYFIGAGVNPAPVNMEEEMEHFERKVEAGAEYAITQPIFDVDKFKDFLDRIDHLDIPIIAGVWPLVSTKNAEFMNNELPEVTVSEKIMEKMKATSSKEEARQTGIKIAQETIMEIKDFIAGVEVSMPFGKVEYPLKVLEVLD